MSTERPDMEKRRGRLLGVATAGFAVLLVVAYFVSSLLPLTLAAGALLAAYVLVEALRGS